MNTIRVHPGASSESRPSWSGVDSTSSTIRWRPGHVPPSIPAAQRYFWTKVWQAGEAESREDLAAGDVRRFDDPLEAIRWLLSEDD